MVRGFRQRSKMPLTTVKFTSRFVPVSDCLPLQENSSRAGMRESRAHRLIISSGSDLRSSCAESVTLVPFTLRFLS